MPHQLGHPEAHRFVEPSQQVLLTSPSRILGFSYLSRSVGHDAMTFKPSATLNLATTIDSNTTLAPCQLRPACANAEVCAANGLVMGCKQHG
jgi:hypothetical protein